MQSQFETPQVSPFFTSTLTTFDGWNKTVCIAGPFIGAPYAAMLLESLIAKGAEKMIVLGWCGAVTDQLNVGDIILPVKAIVDEGTSVNYRILDEKIPFSEPDLNFTDRLSDHLTSCEIGFEKTTIWTTDAIYRETPKKVAYFRDLGAHAVEMECSALFSVASYRKVSIAAVLVVSDSVASKDWDPGFRRKKFILARKSVCDAIMGFTRKMGANE